MTLSRRLKRLGAILLILSVSLGATKCSVPGIDVKVYFVDSQSENPDEWALVRTQDNERIPIKDSDGYFCMSPDDMQAVMQYIALCGESE